MIKKKIINQIKKQDQPISIEKYIDLCLYSKNGYYKNSNVIGRKGDFITSPEISQLFGEIIGLVIYSYWHNKINKSFNLIELGPGRGTLLIDLLNITKKFTDFQDSLSIYLIEKNLKLAKEQKINLNKFNYKLKKIKQLSNFKLPSNKENIIYTNEFFDCLPVRQFHKKDNIWFEKMIGLDDDYHSLKIIDKKVKNIKLLKKIDSYKANEVLEFSIFREKLFSKLCQNIKNQGKMAIIIDYGYFERPNNFTLQSLYHNKTTNVLDNIGLQDISSLVDFKSFIKIANSNDLNIDFFSSQREFLLKNGIKKRSKKIMENSTIKQKKDIKEGLERLIDNNKMGNLFKVLIISKKDES